MDRAADSRSVFSYGRLTGVLAVLALCGCTGGLPSIGRWDRRPGSHTYVNLTQRVQLTFPDPRWRVYTSPQDLPATFEWKKPDGNDSSYGILFAVRKLAFLQVVVEPNPAGLDMEDMLAMGAAQLNAEIGRQRAKGASAMETSIVVRRGRRMGLALTGVSLPTGPRVAALVVLVEDRGRFICLVYVTPAALLERQREEFLDIAASFVVPGQPARTDDAGIDRVRPILDGDRPDQQDGPGSQPTARKAQTSFASLSVFPWRSVFMALPSSLPWAKRRQRDA